MDKVETSMIWEVFFELAQLSVHSFDKNLTFSSSIFSIFKVELLYRQDYKANIVAAEAVSISSSQYCGLPILWFTHRRVPACCFEHVVHHIR